MKNKVIVDSRISLNSIDALKKQGFSLIFVPECSNLQKPVCAHPDMSVLKIEDAFFVASDIAHLFVGENVITCDREDKYLLYPNDILFNCAVVGKNVFCKKDYVHKTIINYLTKKGYNVINVNQGYARCSTCIVTENAIITEDDSIEKAAVFAGIDVLKIEKGYVKLYGYNYGFIGGASGLLNENLLCFNGNIKNHPNYCCIHDFCRKHNVEILSLTNEDLYDVGSIIAF